MPLCLTFQTTREEGRKTNSEFSTEVKENGNPRRLIFSSSLRTLVGSLSARAVSLVVLPSLCCCGEGSASSLSPSLCRGVRKSRPAAGPSSCPLVPGHMRHASPRPIDPRSRISLRTVAVICLRSRAPLSFLHLLPLAVERSRRWSVTRRVDRVAASDCVVSCRRWFLSSPPRRPSSVAGIVDLIVPLVGGASQAIFGRGHRRSGLSFSVRVAGPCLLALSRVWRLP